MIGVYVIRNTVSEKVYVGSSLDVSRRLKAHLSNLRSRRHRNQYLQRAWDKHGETAFEFSMVEESTRETVIATEQKWIDSLGAADEARGYNACPKAASVGSLPKSEEHRAKIGASQRGRKRSPETCARISAAMAGKTRRPLSAEQKAKISTAKKGRPMSEEARKKLSAAKTGVKTGPCSNERRAAISATKRRSKDNHACQ